jgi:hypothetical protein
VVFVTATLYAAVLPLASCTMKSHVPPGSLDAAPGVTEKLVAPLVGEMLAAAASFT